MTTTVHEIESTEQLDALLARESGEVTIRCKVGICVELRLPRVVRLMGGWLRLLVRGARAEASAAGARAEASADGALAVAYAAGARAVASAAGARAVAYADGAVAEAYADGARAEAYEDVVARHLSVTLEDVAEAARWAALHKETAGEIGGKVRRYDQGRWDCETTCCVWGGAHLMRTKEPTKRGPVGEWVEQSERHRRVADLLMNPSAKPEEIEAACKAQP